METFVAAAREWHALLRDVGEAFVARHLDAAMQLAVALLCQDANFRRKFTINLSRLGKSTHTGGNPRNDATCGSSRSSEVHGVAHDIRRVAFVEAQAPSAPSSVTAAKSKRNRATEALDEVINKRSL
ncbi:hypothetical protein PHYPSEUDO_011826 [Phytophthora pseudosyringae]|uniref:Uncharacterized protein n=1 Tax=Phytophthora pseudosyringae TaxID=221518 RepID=A0A8T1VB77_9STRA|nr:hypothetical protein PHYPSEUDO_011826 [Phytophthora pseudosyringae]